MKYETSAGGVVIKKFDGTLFILLLKDKSGKWTFPKGLIERGEEAKKTAEREICEEVGITRVKLLMSLAPIHYFYKWEGKLVNKTVHYFLFQAEGNEPLIPQREEGILDVRWFTTSEANKNLGYTKTNKYVLAQALKNLPSL